MQRRHLEIVLDVGIAIVVLQHPFDHLSAVGDLLVFPLHKSGGDVQCRMAGEFVLIRRRNLFHQLEHLDRPKGCVPSPSTIPGARVEDAGAWIALGAGENRRIVDRFQMAGQRTQPCAC